MRSLIQSNGGKAATIVVAADGANNVTSDKALAPAGAPVPRFPVLGDSVIVAFISTLSPSEVSMVLVKMTEIRCEYSV